MTEIAQALQALALEKTVCPRCEAGLTEPCTTTAGKTTKMHSGRWEPLAEAYQMTGTLDPEVKAQAQRAVDALISTRNIDLTDVFEALERSGYGIVRADG